MRLVEGMENRKLALDQERAQRLLQRARGEAYTAESGRWLSWKIRKIEPDGDTCVIYSGLTMDRAFDLVRELNAAMKEGMEMGWEQGSR
jgi:hypothetical protein